MKLVFWVFDKWQGYWFDSRVQAVGDLVHLVKLASTEIFTVHMQKLKQPMFDIGDIELKLTILLWPNSVTVTKNTNKEF